MTPSTAPETIKAHPGKYLTFILGNESYGIAVLKVREIIKLQDVTSLPQMPKHIKGVINLRGKIVPVVDLRLRFNLKFCKDTDSTCIIVVNRRCENSSSPTLMGLIVDGVEEVANIMASEIESTPDFGGSETAGYILGMAKIKSSVKALIDIDKCIEGDEEALQQIQKTETQI